MPFLCCGAKQEDVETAAGAAEECPAALPAIRDKNEGFCRHSKTRVAKQDVQF